ncbi:hypothetical protein GCM10029964_078380 [Kibdelosporangium lantanae]
MVQAAPPGVRIVAVDSEGSAAFDRAPGVRMIPGLGSSTRPPMLDRRYLDEVVVVPERDTVRTCHALAARGFVFGGSTGTVVSAATSWLAGRDAGRTCVAIAPDLGERYLDTIYRTDWVQETYGTPAGSHPADQADQEA